MNEDNYSTTRQISEGHHQGYTLTGYGWVIILVAIAAILLTYKFLSKKSGSDDFNKKPKAGCLSFGYVFLVIFSIATLALGGLAMLGNSIYNIASLPRYQATVTGHNSHQSESRDDKGRRRSTTMYTPILKFKDNTGTEVEKEADLSSSGKEAMGSVLTVAYENGMDKVVVISTTKYFMLLGLATIMFVLVYVLVLGIAYSFGIPTGRLLQIGAGFLMYYLVPAGMLLLFYGCAYGGVYLYFTGRKPDMPIWAVVVCCFFSVVLFFSLIGWARMLLGKGDGKKGKKVYSRSRSGSRNNYSW